MPLVQDGGGLDDSPMNFCGLEMDLEFGVASHNFQAFQVLSCILMGMFCVIY
jgi:hypothetical protein